MGALSKIAGGLRGLFQPNDRRIAKVAADLEIYSDGFVPASQFSGSTDLDTLYIASEWAYSCIVTSALQAASLGAQVQRSEGDRWIRAEHEALESFLAEPSGASAAPTWPPTFPSPPQWTWGQMIFLAVAHELLAGNAYWVPTIGGTSSRRRILRALPVLPNDVTITTDTRTGYPTSYWIAGDQELAPNQVIHFLFTNPGSLSSGHAPLTAALRSVGIDSDAIERIRWHLYNKVDAGLVVSMAGFMGVTADQRTATQEALRLSYSQATQSGRPLVLGEGTKVLATPDQRHTIDYSGLFAEVRQRILSAFRVPPPVVGVYDNATLNNFSTAFRVWWLLGLFPILQGVYDSLNTQLVWPVYGRDWRLWYDSAQSEIAVQMLREHAETAKVLVDMGYPPNLAARKVGIDIEHVPELDTPLQNLAVAGRENTEPNP
jgi:hypothetical protein